ncbi:Fasciclin-like arabinogalactan protein 2 [Nymphaea thermarum]|nr:Fasciclin-like arabinogalactan protein 2 [Nymphaea thermarum]
MGTASTVVAFLLVAFLAGGPLTGEAHNITRILAKFPNFSTFNHYLSVTHLAAEINRHTTITVFAVDNSAMADLLAKDLPIASIKNELSLHVCLDYFGAKKLHQITNGTALCATLYQATGSAPGTSGFINITDLTGGKVGFGAVDNGDLDASFVKSLKEIPYNISVIQISSILSSPVAEAPAPSPADLNLTSLMSKQGCKNFADLLTATGAVKTYMDNAVGGLTVFCPTDEVITKFAPTYKNLTKDEKQTLLLYHAAPVYLPIASLKSNNGPLNTLATNGASNYAFTVQNQGEEVTLRTKVVTASITGTLYDQDPVVIFTIDKVLEPKELFKGAPSPAPAADSPAPSSSADAHSSSPSPDSPDSAPSDSDTADSSDGVKLVAGGSSMLMVVVGLLL